MTSRVVSLNEFRRSYTPRARLRGDDDGEDLPPIQTGTPAAQQAIQVIQQKAAEAACDDGSFYNYATGQCEKGEYEKPECPDGQEWDADAWECVPVQVGTPKDKGARPTYTGGSATKIEASMGAKALVLGAGALLGGAVVGGLTYAGARVAGSKSTGKLGAAGALAGAIAGATATYYASIKA